MRLSEVTAPLARSGRRRVRQQDYRGGESRANNRSETDQALRAHNELAGRPDSG
jgi:hypothetical protein